MVSNGYLMRYAVFTGKTRAAKIESMKKAFISTVFGIVSIGLTGVTAIAQAPPAPGPPPDSNPMFSYAVAIGLLLLVGFAAFKPSKRGHQD